jgi:hypothetical protein
MFFRSKLGIDTGRGKGGFRSGFHRIEDRNLIGADSQCLEAGGRNCGSISRADGSRSVRLKETGRT